MKTLLLHARTFARIAPRLKGLNAALNIVTVDDAARFHDAWTSEALKEAPAVDLAFGNIDAFYSPSVREFMTAILKSPDFDWFQSAAAGIENPALVAIGQKSKRYTTNHTQAESMAEWAIWQAMDFFRDGPGHRANQARGEWKRIAVREMQGSRWLIVGYGSIGQAVGKRVSALGGVVTGMRRTPGPAGGAARVVAPDTLMAELPGADVVLLCPPHTPETEGMADAAFFAAMNPDALFLNLGRGALVDEDALMAALDAGRPAFAALDVTKTEPLPEDSALWKHHKIVITPHDSSDTPGTVARGDETFLANLQLYLDNEPMKHLVDRSAFLAG
ncbi:D-isomer specific 2-hydroxyacid dehydrogenase family protein [Hyphomonas neptunium ATCC 15444]|uniref:D-isomer specific 2-hydroxyacid dehydrogenase family protein n=2 Tax=Hyphomonas TaxID=85 RepID=Q0BYH5_HYPNA|nr:MULTISPECIES: NAD(P)-dependent oxidoreductase [Hyphomonas]ABI76717.1 D-isomer specific 2-hydroxyacid dehydrogenase family protein [Hyphomonas neptunium ATCC 15444]KCZ87060.1 D-isomer specific 2-hydroxyacid dehydrogenase family protein [Hyphomonas hirschiana VP5]